MENKEMFEKFVLTLKNDAKEKLAVWDKGRNKHIKDTSTKKKLILQELSIFNYKDPLDSLDKNYLLDKYTSALLMNELKNITSILAEETKTELVEKCDYIERIKKILDFYLTFVIERNFEFLMMSMKKLKFFENGIEGGLKLTQQLNEKVHIVKHKNIRNSARILLNKQKMKNLLDIFRIVKLKVFKCHNLYLEAKTFKKQNKFCGLFYKLKEILTELDKTSQMLHPKKLTIIEILKEKCNRKMFKLTNSCQTLFSNLFISRKDELYEELFLFYLAQGNYIERLKYILKNNIFMVIKETLFAFSEDQMIRKDEVQKTVHLAKLRFDSNKFISGLNHVFANSAKILENFWFYINLHKKLNLTHPTAIELNNQIIKYFENPNKDGGMREFFEIAEKKYSKLFYHFQNLVNEFSFRNLIYFSLYSSLFLDYMYSIFGVNYSNHLKPQIQDLVRKNLTSCNRKSIIKMGNLLSVETWQRLPLQDNYEFFSNVKLQENAPFYVKDLMNIFNESDVIKSINIKISFHRLLEQYAYGKFNSFNSDECKVEIFTRPLNNRNMTISSSTKNLMDQLLNLITYLVFYDNMCFEVFDQIFNLYNYFLISAIYMFIDFNNICLIYDNININELMKNQAVFYQKISIFVEIIKIQKSNSNIVDFLTKTKGKLEELFSCKINLLKDTTNEVYGYNQFHIPNNKVGINKSTNNMSNNIYASMTETIILYESLHSIYKIIKRLKNFTKKLEFEFQQREIEETINNYKPLLKELRKLLYEKICGNIFRIDPVLNKIVNFNWDPKDEDIHFSENSQFVDNIYQEICEKYDKMDFLSGGSLNEKSKRRFLDIIFCFMKDKLLESFSKIKRCSSFGRGLMLKDVKILKSKLESKFACDLNSIFGELVIYINAWYYTEDELLKYIKQTNINYNHIQGLIYSGPEFIKLNSKERNDLNNRINQTYIQLMTEANELLDKLKK